MKSTLIAAILLSMGVQPAFARDNTARPNAAEFKNPKTTRGLCTSDNQGQEYYDEGYCKSLFEAMTKKPCFKDLVEDLRQRQINQDEKRKEFMMTVDCDQGKKGRGTMADIAKDPARWTSLLMSIISNFVIHESEWDVKRDKNSSKIGLLRISKESMDDPKYKCGCNFDPIQSDPIDGHQNIICGAYQALYWASKDGVLYSGRDGRQKSARKQEYQSPQEKPKDARDERLGLARIFESAEYNPDDKVSEARHEKLDKKMQNYCENYAHTRNGVFDADMTPDYNNGSPSTGIKY